MSDNQIKNDEIDNKTIKNKDDFFSKTFDSDVFSKILEMDLASYDVEKKSLEEKNSDESLQIKALDSSFSENNKIDDGKISKSNVENNKKLNDDENVANNKSDKNSKTFVDADFNTKGYEKKKSKFYFVNKVKEVIASINNLMKPFENSLVSNLPVTKIFTTPIKYFFAAIFKIIVFLVYGLSFSRVIVNNFVVKIFLFLCVILFIGQIFSTRFINTEKGKNYFSSFVKKNTGYEMIIKGNLKVYIIPSFLVEVSNVEFVKNKLVKNNNLVLNNMKINKLILKIDLLTLLTKFKIKIDEVELIRPYISFILSPKKSLDTQFNFLDSMVKINSIPMGIIEDNSKENMKANLMYSIGFDKNRKSSSIFDNIYNEIYIIKKENEPIEQFVNNSDKNVFDNKNITTNTVVSKSSNGNILYDFVKKLTMDLKESSFKKITISNGEVLFSNKEKTVIYISGVNFEMNADENQETDFIANIKFELLKNNFYLNAISKNKNLKINGASGNYNEKMNDILLVGSFDDSNDFVGSLEINDLTLLNILKTIFLNLDFKEINDAKFVVDNLRVNSSYIYFDKYSLKIDNKDYRGSFSWGYGTTNDMYLKVDLIDYNLGNIFDYSVAGYENYVGKLVNVIMDKYYQGVKNLSPNFFELELDVSNLISLDSTGNVNNLGNLFVSLFFDGKNSLYVDKFNLQLSDANLSGYGKLVLDSKTGYFNLNLKGQSISIAKMFGLGDRATEMFVSLNDGYGFLDIQSILNIENNKLMFHNINGKFANKKFTNAMAVINNRLELDEVDLILKVDNFDYNYLNRFYEKILKKQSENVEISILPIKDDLVLKISLNADTFNYNNLVLKDFFVDVVMSKNNISLNNFEIKSLYSGSIRGNLLIDRLNTNFVTGNLTFDKLFFNLKNVNDIMFGENKLQGNIFIDGQFKVNVDSLEKIANGINGVLSVGTLERYKNNKISISNGFYITMEKIKNDEIAVQDLFGKLNVINGKIDFYPVVVLFIDSDGKKRGSFEGNYNFYTNKFDLKGYLSDSKNIKVLEFDILGPIKSPDINVKKTAKKVKYLSKKIEKDIDKLSKIKKDALPVLKGENSKINNNPLNTKSIGKDKTSNKFENALKNNVIESEKEKKKYIEEMKKKSENQEIKENNDLPEIY